VSWTRTLLEPAITVLAAPGSVSSRRTVQLPPFCEGPMKVRVPLPAASVPDSPGTATKVMAPPPARMVWLVSVLPVTVTAPVARLTKPVTFGAREKAGEGGVSARERTAGVEGWTVGSVTTVAAAFSNPCWREPNRAF
jgi:hypothetical protein